MPVSVDMAGVAAERVVQFRENEQSSAEELIPDYSRLGAPTGASAAGEQAVADEGQSDMEARVASMAAESPVLGMNFPMQHQGVQIDTQALGALMSQLMQVQMALLDRVLEATSSLSQRLDKLESSRNSSASNSLDGGGGRQPAAVGPISSTFSPEQLGSLQTHVQQLMQQSPPSSVSLLGPRGEQSGQGFAVGEGLGVAGGQPGEGDLTPNWVPRDPSGRFTVGNVFSSVARAFSPFQRTHAPEFPRTRTPIALRGVVILGPDPV